MAILDPLDKLIKKYQSDSVPLSEVVSDLLQLPEAYHVLLTKNVLKREEYHFVIQQINERFDFLISPAHLMVFFFLIDKF